MGGRVGGLVKQYSQSGPLGLSVAIQFYVHLISATTFFKIVGCTPNITPKTIGDIYTNVNALEPRYKEKKISSDWFFMAHEEYFSSLLGYQ